MAAISPDQVLSHFLQIPLVADTLLRLERELSPELTYHSADHTRAVLREALNLGVTDNLAYHQLYLLMFSALFHDIGFLVQRNQNEAICARMARELLASQPDLSALDLNLIATMISDTELKATPTGPKQVASTLLSGYLLDADLGNFGREDFLEMTELVRHEVGAPDKKTFLRSTLTLFDAHEWYSPAAKLLRQGQKEINRGRLLELIGQ